VASSPGSNPSAYPSGSDVTAPTASSGSGPAGEPEAPTGPSGTTTDLSAGSTPGRESFPLGSSVSAEERARAGSAGAPKSGTTQGGDEQD
jgi:hypothetical protein